jgi:hypothetical protein
MIEVLLALGVGLMYGFFFGVWAYRFIVQQGPPEKEGSNERSDPGASKGSASLDSVLRGEGMGLDKRGRIPSEQIVGFEACWRDCGHAGRCRKPKGHEGPCAPVAFIEVEGPPEKSQEMLRVTDQPQLRAGESDLRDDLGTGSDQKSGR